MASLTVLRARAKKQNQRERDARVKAKATGRNKEAVALNRAMMSRDRTVRAIAMKNVKR